VDFQPSENLNASSHGDVVAKAKKAPTLVNPAPEEDGTWKTRDFLSIQEQEEEQNRALELVSTGI